MIKLLAAMCVFFACNALAQDTTAIKVPFDNMNATWINGQNRQTDFPLTLNDKSTGAPIVTGVLFTDCYYNYNFNNPKDNTHTVSSSIGRTNEFCVNQVSLGLESGYKNAIGRLWLQYGQMISLVQEQDASVGHGRNTNIDNLKYIREVAAGYHFDKWYGINVELGMFMSYIGLESYVLNENWCYQRSMLCEFTAFYFTGARFQLFPSKKVKTELWLMNGWQSYNSYNSRPGIGSATMWRPNENLQLVANFYVAGKDTRSNDNALRFHHDHSIVGRYFSNPVARGISQAAWSINNHYGFESGGGKKAAENYMLGTSIAHRLWFFHNKAAVTLRADYLTHPGLYLAPSPSPVTPNRYTAAIAANSNHALDLLQGVATIDIMPTQHFTIRLEYGYRSANAPYFAGPGGTTSPDGWVGTPTGAWQPSLTSDEHRLTAAACFRL